MPIHNLYYLYGYRTYREVTDSFLNLLVSLTVHIYYRSGNYTGVLIFYTKNNRLPISAFVISNVSPLRPYEYMCNFSDLRPSTYLEVQFKLI